MSPPADVGPRTNGSRGWAFFGGFVALVAIAGTIGRDVAAQDYDAARATAVWAGISILAGVVLGFGLLAMFLPGELRRRRVLAATNASLAVNARRTYATMPALLEMANEFGWPTPLPSVGLGFTMSAERSGLAFWADRQARRSFGSVPWTAIDGFDVVRPLTRREGRPRLIVKLKSGVVLDVFIGLPSLRSLWIAGEEFLTATVNELDDLRAHALN
jgi:hypothetical protein